MKTKTLLISLLSFMTIFSSCSDVDSDSIPVPEIKLNENSLKVYKWDEIALIASTLSDEPVNKNVIWSSSDPKTVSVNEKGEIKALKKGTATITAKNVKYSATCDVTVNPNIYVVGHSTASTLWTQGDSILGTIWKNGQEIIMPREAKETRLQSVYVSNGDVYIIGNETTDGQNSMALWKNNQILMRRDINSYGYFRSIYVDGKDVYVTGHIMDDISKKYKAKLWKNNEEIALSPNARESIANSVFVFNGDVYITGSCDGNAMLWKNGQEIALPTKSFFNGVNISSEAYSVFVSNGDVYVVGDILHYNSVGYCDLYAAILWKNGEEIILDSNSDHRLSARSVYVSDEITYVAGWENKNAKSQVAKLWKDGKETILTIDDKLASVESVFVSENNVYIAGGEYDYDSDCFIAKLWKNEESTNLTDKNKVKLGYAYSVFVEE